MENKIAIKCEHLYKKYPLYTKDFERLKGLLLPKYKPQEFVALKDVNLEFKQGEIIGLIGLNGSGKSTLSSIITGITYPTAGHLTVNGTVNMLSAAAGMENNLTGIENIEYKCLLLGFSKNKIDRLRKKIIEFADIGLYIEQPLRTYSSGMKSRLGFAISIYMEPDILIIDEALSVGDNSFAERCLNKMNEFKKMGKTILFVSHSVMQMEKFCDKIVWLHQGEVLGEEQPDKILRPYCGFAREINMMTIEEKQLLKPTLKEYQEKYL